MYWLRLIRWNNLLIILLTQLLAWWCVIVPLEQADSTPLLLLSPANFTLLCLSTILIAAGGYIINDYFDIRIDAINKPDKVILEKQIPRRLAIIVHSALNAVALLMALVVGWQMSVPALVLFQGACTFLLWRYSTTWKRQFMIGNVVVSLMTALSIITLIIYEPGLFVPRSVIPGWHAIIGWPGMGYINPVAVLLLFSFFAFVLTWMREIVKDMEDYKGDAEDGCVTMPILWGIGKSIRFTRILGSVALAVILYCVYASFKLDTRLGQSGFMPYYLLVLFGSIAGWLFFIDRKLTKQHFHKASNYLKIIMVLGIGSLIIYRLQYA